MKLGNSWLTAPRAAALAPARARFAREVRASLDGVPDRDSDARGGHRSRDGQRCAGGSHGLVALRALHAQDSDHLPAEDRLEAGVFAEDIAQGRVDGWVQRLSAEVVEHDGDDASLACARP